MRNLLKEFIVLIEDKQSELNPLAVYLSNLILIELKKYRQIPYFKGLPNKDSKILLLYNKRAKANRQAYAIYRAVAKVFVESSTRDINQVLIVHTIKFINHFSLSAEFILNEKLKIDDKQKLNIFADKNNLKINIPIEKKLDQMIETSASTIEDQKNQESEKQAKLNVGQKPWSPKDENELAIKNDTKINFNIKDNYPKPSPNYLPPIKLPIPMNDLVKT